MLVSRRHLMLFTASALAMGGTHVLAAVNKPQSKLLPFLGVWEAGRRRRPGAGPGGPGFRNDGKRPPRPDGPGPGRMGPPPGGRGAEADDPVPGMDNGDRHVYRLMTEEGRAAFRALDPKDLPANNCISPGLPHIVGVPGPQEWRLRDGNLEIHHAYYDTWRTVHLDHRDAPAGTSLSHAGYASGWFDGSIFVIRTTHLAATPGGLARNAPSSDARTVVERYRIADGGNALRGEMVITDPKFLTQAMSRQVELARAPEGVTVESLPCDLESARSYLDQQK